MTAQRFILTTMLLFLLGTLPFLAMQPSAASGAGLSLGFSAPLEHRALLVVLALTGGVAALLPRNGLLLLPIAFSLMVMVGGILTLDVSHLATLQYFVLGTMLSLGLLVGLAREKLSVLMVLVLASLGFHMGGFFMQAVPPIASPMYYLIGVLVSLGMLLAIAVAFGMTLVGDNEATWERIKQSSRVAPIRAIFL